METRVPLDDDEKRRLIFSLVTRLRCAGCGQAYDPQSFSLVHRGQDVWVLGAQCDRCREPVHVIVFMRLDKHPGSVVDLTPDEIEASLQWPPITSDDVLDVHELLEEFDGDLAALIAG